MSLDPDRTLSDGALVKVDFAGGTSYETVGCIQEISPPDSEVESVEATVLEDDREAMIPGRKKATKFTFKALWRNGSDFYEDAKDAQDNKNDCAWQIVYPFPDAPKTESFHGFIEKLGRAKVVSKDLLACEVTVVTTDEPVIT